LWQGIKNIPLLRLPPNLSSEARYPSVQKGRLAWLARSARPRGSSVRWR